MTDVIGIDASAIKTSVGADKLNIVTDVDPVKFGITGSMSPTTISCATKRWYSFVPQDDMTPVEAVYICFCTMDMRRGWMSLDEYGYWDKIKRHFVLKDGK